MKVLDYDEVVFSVAGNTRAGDMPVEMKLSMYKFVLACSKTGKLLLVWWLVKSTSEHQDPEHGAILFEEGKCLWCWPVLSVKLWLMWTSRTHHCWLDSEPNIKFYIMAHSLYVRGHVSLWCSVCASWQERPVIDSFYLWVVVGRKDGVVCLMLWSHLSPVTLKGSGKEITRLLCPCYGSFICP